MLDFTLLSLGRKNGAPWRHNPISLPFWRIYWNARPGWTLTWEDRVFQLGPERVVLIWPEAVFAASGKHPAGHVFVHFTAEAPIDRHRPRVAELPVDGTIQALLAQLEPFPGPQRELASAALAMHLFARITLVQTPEGKRYSPPIQAAMALGLRYLHRRVPNIELAPIAGMHLTAFVRRFRQEVGLSPQAWHVRQRIAQASRALIQGPEPISAIAAQCGFCDRAHFSRVFSRLLGLGPASYRDKAGKA